MQINRLFEIVYILLDKKTITAKELSEHFEVSKRTIYRDLDILCQAGIPIYTAKGKGGGIRILPEFILNKSMLTETEQNEILSALQSLSALNGTAADPVINKLSAFFKKDNENWIDVDFSHWGSDEKEREKFTLIKNSILEKQTIAFDYFSSYGEKTNRIVEPLKLLFKSQSWYLYGYCHLKYDYRIFKINRIQNSKAGGDSFEREVPQNIWNEGDYSITMVDLVLKFDSEMAYRIYDEFPAENIVVHGDGSFTVTTSIPFNEWIYGYIMSFGEYVEVLEPAAIKDEIKKKYAKVIKKYL